MCKRVTLILCMTACLAVIHMEAEEVYVLSVIT